jgi:NAD(P)-dependent dehydrogenase (short-subunit alcohol dehydrogenase family)
MVADNLSLAGKVAIVTGSGRENGIGAAIATTLARNGAAVTINYVSEASKPRAQSVAEKIRAEGGKATVIRAAVDQEGAQKLVDGTLKAFGTDHIDILGKLQSFESSFSLIDADYDCSEQRRQRHLRWHA